MHRGRRPPTPPRGRSRSSSASLRSSDREERLRRAHLRNINQRRGGDSSRRRTKAIHIGQLEIAQDKHQRSLQYLFVGYTIFQSQLDRVQARLAWLKRRGNYPNDKRLVLPSLRMCEEGYEIETVHSRSELDTVYVASGSEEIPAESLTLRAFGQILHQLLLRFQDLQQQVW